MRRRTWLVLALVSLGGCASQVLGPEHPHPVSATLIVDRTDVRQGGATPHFVVGPNGSAVGLVFAGSWVNFHGRIVFRFTLLRRGPEGWEPGTELLFASEIRGWDDSEPLDFPRILAAGSTGETWWVLFHDEQAPLRYVRAEMDPHREYSPAVDEGWRAAAGTNPTLHAWFVDALNASTIEAERLPAERVAAILAQQQSVPRLENGWHLQTWRRGHLEYRTAPARLTGADCPFPLASPVLGGRVIRTVPPDQLPFATGPESGVGALVFGVDRDCPLGDEACERADTLYLGLCLGGWRTLEIGQGADPAIHVEPDGTILIAYRARPAGGTQIVTVTAPPPMTEGWSVRPR